MEDGRLTGGRGSDAPALFFSARHRTTSTLILRAVRNVIDTPIPHAVHASLPMLVADRPCAASAFIAKHREIPYCC
jgi:hypothetical protein